MSDRRQRLGTTGEAAAACYLERRGWRLLARNARTRYGELDLIGLDGSTLVFVEVKTLRGAGRKRAERAIAAIGPRKRSRVRLLARAWLAEPGPRPGYREIRFDAIGVALAAGRPALIEHVEAAF